ncbi:hypothetical protein D3C84_340590 [compost metagenome]
MSYIDLYPIEYKLHDQPRIFVIRASCDAGIAPIPKPGHPPLKIYSRPLAQRYGLTDVRWCEAATLNWAESSQ